MHDDSRCALFAPPAELRIENRFDVRLSFAQPRFLLRQTELAGNSNRVTEMHQRVIPLILGMVRFIHPGVDIFCLLDERGDILLT
jgi:hypothetical protein